VAAAGFKLAFAALACAACTSIAADARTFEGTEWRVTAINGSPTPQTDNYRVNFRNGQFGGRFGCNSFGGAYQLRSSSILSVGPVAVTEMACEGPGMAFENSGFAVLRDPLQINWTSARHLTLSNANGSIQLERMP
jgi:heat shock protein HslJ